MQIHFAIFIVSDNLGGFMNLIIIETLKGIGVLLAAAIVVGVLVQGSIILYGWLGEAIGLIPLFPIAGFFAYLVGQAISSPRKRKA